LEIEASEMAGYVYYFADLGAQFRRFRTRLGPPVATKAMAAKLARLLYRMLRFGMKYVDQGAELNETQHSKQQVIHLKRKAAPLGLHIVEVAAAA
jgi:transposase